MLTQVKKSGSSYIKFRQVDFKERQVISDKEGQYIMIKVSKKSIVQEDIKMQNTSVCILAKLNTTDIKRTIHHDQMKFIPECKDGSIYKNN